MKLAPADRLRAWLPLVFPVLLLATTYWLNQQVQPLEIRPDAKKRHDVDFVVENIKITTLDERGNPRFTLSAEKMSHFPDDDTTHLHAPRFVSSRTDGSQITASAQTGKIAPRGDDIELYDGVNVVRSNPAQQTEATFSTEYLYVQPKLDKARTDQAIRLTTANATLTAVGMEMDFQSHHSQFLSHVRAQYEPLIR